MRTCDRCLDGRHIRCTDKTTCACRCRRQSAQRPVAGGVIRAATPGKPSPRRHPTNGRRGGPVPTYAGDRRQRRAASARAARAAGIDRDAVGVELTADPAGVSWSIQARRLFAVECDRLEVVLSG